MCKVRGYRKFALALICLFMAFTGLLLGRLGADVFANIIIFIMGLYAAGNVGAALSNGKKKDEN
jgi:lipopolysaccharide export LptBFGC system permease protein LptF